MLMTHYDYDVRCYVCSNAARARRYGDGEDVDCPRCTTYRITGTVARLLENMPLNEVELANASGWLRETHDPVLTSNDLDRLRRIPSPSVDDQATKLLRFIAKQHPVPGTGFDVPYDGPQVMGAAWAVNKRHSEFLLREYLVGEKHYFTLLKVGADAKGYHGRISPAGWAYLDSLKATNADSEYAFIAMSFDESMLTLRKEGIFRAIEGTGYRPLVIDEKDFNADIVDEILADIRRSRFVVADFTQQKNGVYFEAGFAQGLGLQVIRTCRRAETKELHFDVNHYSFVLWDDDQLPDFVDRLRRRIEAVIGRGPVPTA